MNAKQYSVILPISGRCKYDYLSDLLLNQGDIVIVNFRGKDLCGMVLCEGSELIAQDKLKKVIAKLPIEPISNNFFKFINHVSEYNLADLGAVFKMVIGTNLGAKLIKKQASYKKQVITSNINLEILSDEQKIAADYLTQNLSKYNATLLEGVTGSGKTEVYFHVIAKILEQEGQVLILLPEICLTSQLISRFEQKFGFKPAIWHSDIALGSKYKSWLECNFGNEKVVIGARSALFLPFKNLQLIIVDEEHDPSYKQEENPIYNGRDMAVLRAFYENIPVILASATPAIETIVNCKNDKYHHLYLASRYGGAVLPEINIIDMRKNPKKQFISDKLRQVIVQNFNEQKQTLLFLNRRGYAPLTICGDCGYRYQCVRCSAWMIEHKKTGKLCCHHCGYNIKTPTICASCNAQDSITHCGPGVERIAEEVKSLLPNARIIEVTKDTIKTHKQASQVVGEIINHEVDIIVGTQLIAKGYHFPKLTVVGIIDADLGLFGGDLRAAEHTYHLLHQVAGRSGREEDLGRVYMQTHQPDNKILKSLLNDDQQFFVNEEIINRKNAMMPPFTKMVSIIMTGKRETKIMEYAKLLCKKIHEKSGDKVNILGPAPATINLVQGQYRYRILLICSRIYNIQEILRHIFNELPKNNIIRTKIDIDPYNFL
jgi:primosomal protein N' (replication factor Y) (superfamily II helicase)